MKFCQCVNLVRLASYYCYSSVCVDACPPRQICFALFSLLLSFILIMIDTMLQAAFGVHFWHAFKIYVFCHTCRMHFFFTHSEYMFFFTHSDFFSHIQNICFFFQNSEYMFFCSFLTRIYHWKCSFLQKSYISAFAFNCFYYLVVSGISIYLGTFNVLNSQFIMNSLPKGLKDFITYIANPINPNFQPDPLIPPIHQYYPNSRLAQLLTIFCDSIAMKYPPVDNYLNAHVQNFMVKLGFRFGFHRNGVH